MESMKKLAFSALICRETVIPPNIAVEQLFSSVKYSESK